MSMTGENNYATILRRISMFGGVQVFNVFVNLVRGKFVAMLLGPSGMGVSSLLASSAATVQQFSALGTSLSIVREISAAKDDPAALAGVLASARRVIVLTALLGALVCILLSPVLSRVAFGGYGYTWSFVCLSVFVGLSVASAGYLSVLQGLGEVKRLSKSSLVGASTGLVCGVPLYWLFGVGGIVPAMIILSAAMFLFYYLSFRSAMRGRPSLPELPHDNALIRRLVSLGLVLMAGSLAGTVVGYAINAFVRAFGSVDDVGLFQAANSLTTQYTGMIFAALSMDYFPRLSAATHDRALLNGIVNRQIEMVMIVLTPIVLALLLTAPFLIRLLLTSGFLPVTPLVRWLGFGALLQGISFPLGYVILAYGSRRAYFWIEVVAGNVLWLAFSVALYYTLGLTGLGVSFVARSALDIVVYYVFIRRAYRFGLSGGAGGTALVSLALGSAGFVVSLCAGEEGWVVVAAILLVSVVWSALSLRSRIRFGQKED